MPNTNTDTDTRVCFVRDASASLETGEREEERNWLGLILNGGKLDHKNKTLKCSFVTIKYIVDEKHLCDYNGFCLLDGWAWEYVIILTQCRWWRPTVVRNFFSFHFLFAVYVVIKAWWQLCFSLSLLGSHLRNFALFDHNTKWDSVNLDESKFRYDRLFVSLFNEFTTNTTTWMKRK